MNDEREIPKTRPVPLWLPVTGVILLLLGIFVAPMITNSFDEQQLNRVPLYSGISFIMIFISLIIFFAAFVWWLAVRFNHRVSYSTYRILEYLLIGGIVVGIVGMFQPWVFVAFRYGFYLLLLSTIGFIAWSHVTPAPEEDEFATE